MIDANIAAKDPSACLSIDNPKPSPYWLSPNLIMTTKPSDPNDVYPGTNSTSISVSWAAGCTIPSELAVVLDLYIGDPTLPMIPGSASMGTIASPFPTPNGVNISPGQSNVVTSVTWNSSVVPTLTQSVGVNQYHGCLLARVYPFGATPDTGDLTGYPATDPHYAQHNCVVTTASAGTMFKMPINNGNVSRVPITVSVYATPDLKPAPIVLKAIQPGLELVKGYKRIATTALAKPVLDLSIFKVVTATPVSGLKAEPILETPLKAETIAPVAEVKAPMAEVKAPVAPAETLKAPANLVDVAALETETLRLGGITGAAVLPPQHFAKFNFTADLTGATVGDAHVWHISQVTAQGQPYGGLTVVVVIT